MESLDQGAHHCVEDDCGEGVTLVDSNLAWRGISAVVYVGVVIVALRLATVLTNLLGA